MLEMPTPSKTRACRSVIPPSTTTSFPLSISITNSAVINNLTVTVALTHPGDQNLQIQLQGPDGSKPHARWPRGAQLAPTWAF